MSRIKFSYHGEERDIYVGYVVKEYIEYLETCLIGKTRWLWDSSWELRGRDLWLILDGQESRINYYALWYILDLKRRIHVRNN